MQTAGAWGGFSGECTVNARAVVAGVDYYHGSVATVNFAAKSVSGYSIVRTVGNWGIEYSLHWKSALIVESSLIFYNTRNA